MTFINYCYTNKDYQLLLKISKRLRESHHLENRPENIVKVIELLEKLLSILRNQDKEEEAEIPWVEGS